MEVELSETYVVSTKVNLQVTCTVLSTTHSTMELCRIVPSIPYVCNFTDPPFPRIPSQEHPVAQPA